MPILPNKHDIRSIRQRDRQWCVYALGDLSPRLFPNCQWFTPDLTMVLHELAGIATVGLNVRAGNDAAIRVYESPGCVQHCEFREALATSRQ